MKTESMGKLPNQLNHPSRLVRGLGVPRYVWVIALFSVLWGYFLNQSVGVNKPPFYTLDWRAERIRHPGDDVPRSYFRKEFYLPDNVANAWLQISADNDYILYLNGKKVGWEENLLSNTSPCQEHQSETGQRIGREVPFPIRNPPEAQWRSSRDWTIATFFDIASLLKVGKNVLAVAVQTDRSSAGLLLEGEIEDVLGKTYPVLSDSTWKVSSVPEMELGVLWYQEHFKDSRWQNARTEARPRDKIRARLDPEMFRLPLSGEWIWDPQALGNDSYFRKRFSVESEARDGWVRVGAEGSYDLFINGTLIGRSDPKEHRVVMYSFAPLLRRGLNMIAVHTRGAEETISSAGAPAAPSRLLVDGLIRTDDGRVIPLATDSGWETSQSVGPGWTKAAGQGSFQGFATSLGKPSLDFQVSAVKRYAGSAFSGLVYYRRLSKFCLVCLAGFVFIWLAYSAYLSRKLGIEIHEARRAAVLCYWIPIGFMVCVLLLRFRFGENHHKALFYTNSLWQITTLASTLALVLFKVYLGFLSGTADRMSKGWRHLIQPALSGPGILRSLWIWSYEHRYLVLLGFITFVGAYLRLKGLGVEGYHSDESSSLTPILGIIRTGLPEYPSGVYYTRGPAYHYLAAVFIKLLGLTRFTGRLSSVIFGVLTLPMVYIFGKEFPGDRKAALLAALLLAVSPWAIFMSRSLRFYQQFQFFGLVSAYFFLKGFVAADIKRYQYYALAAFTLTFLSQEVGVTLFAAFFLGYLYLTPRTSWKSKIPLIGALFIVVGIMLGDILLFTFKCLTPPVAISATSLPVVNLHIFRIPELTTTLFVGYNRLNVVLTFFFLLGIPIYLWKRDRIVMFVYALVLVTVAVVTIAVMQIGLRYISEIYTFFVLLTSITIFGIIRWISTFHLHGSPPAFVGSTIPTVQKIMLTLVVVTLILSYQPKRIISSYSSRINRGDTFAQEFVKQHMFDTDLVIAGHHPGAVANITGKVDYYLMQKGLSDEIFEKDGVMIDRRGGAVIVDSIDKLRTVFARNRRVWIIISDLRLKAYDPDLVDFLTKNTKVVYQPFLCTVFLWDQSYGVFDAPKQLGYERYHFD